MRLTDLKKLRHVVEVARAESFTGATAVLAISQSALTKSVADVEHLLDVKLFQRLPRGVRVTEAGQLFVQRAERILADTSDLMTQIGDIQSLRTGHLRIGIAPAAYAAFLENTLSAFVRVYPDIHVGVHDGTIEEIAQALITGQVDMVIGGANYLSPWTELEINVVARLHHFFIARLDHPLTKLQSVTARDLLQYPVIMPAAGLPSESQLVRAYTAAGLSPRTPQYICDQFTLVRKLVASTDAISPVVSLAPASVRFRNRFQVFEDVVELDEQALGIVFARKREPSPAASAFAGIFQGFLRDSDT